MTLERLRNYALWYYGRYFPSVARLREKLGEKTQKTDDINQVMSDIKEYLVEEKVIQDHIENSLTRKKNIFWARKKLREKKFDSEITERLL